MSIRIRLDILLENSLITPDIYIDIMAFIKNTKNKFGLSLTEENAGMFITHLAAAFSRVSKNEAILEINPDIEIEVSQNKNYKIALDILKTLTNNTLEIFPKGEEIFILTYLCSILNEEE